MEVKNSKENSPRCKARSQWDTTGTSRWSWVGFSIILLHYAIIRQSESRHHMVVVKRQQNVTGRVRPDLSSWTLVLEFWLRKNSHSRLKYKQKFIYKITEAEVGHGMLGLKKQLQGKRKGPWSLGKRKAERINLWEGSGGKVLVCCRERGRGGEKEGERERAKHCSVASLMLPDQELNKSTT